MKGFLLSILCLIGVSCLAQDTATAIRKQQWVNEQKKLILGTWYRLSNDEELTLNPDGTGLCKNVNTDKYHIEIKWELTSNCLYWWSVNPKLKLVNAPDSTMPSLVINKDMLIVAINKAYSTNVYFRTKSAAASSIH